MAVNTPQSSRTAPMREIKKLSRIVLLENIEYINISHYKCWKLASVTILPVNPYGISFEARRQRK